MLVSRILEGTSIQIEPGLDDTFFEEASSDAASEMMET